MSEIDELFVGFPAMLNKEDDPGLWRAVLSVLLEEFRFRHAHLDRGTESFFQIGACSHWFRPHQARWTTAGGFAWPSGYLGAEGFRIYGLPEFDWSVTFQLVRGKWQPVSKFSGKRKLVVRIAVPSRTTRHNQAAIHTLWQPEHRLVFYGFRQLNGNWKCVANSEELASLSAEKRAARKQRSPKPERPL